MPSLGYNYPPEDARDHPFRALVAPSPEAVALKPRTRPWRAQASLDQGQTGTCCGHGARHWLQTAPIVEASASGPNPFDLYRAAVLVDEFPENDGEATLPDAQLQSGTSVRAVMKVLKAQGYLKEYVRCYSATTMQVAVRGVTPVLIGTNWSRSMFTPTAEGVIRYDEGQIVGGHCYLIHWFDTGRGLFLLQNSWGAWGADHPTQKNLAGRKGFAYLPGEDMERLIVQEGEAWTAVQSKR